MRSVIDSGNSVADVTLALKNLSASAGRTSAPDITSSFPLEVRTG
jgi:hypothetical protein